MTILLGIVLLLVAVANASFVPGDQRNTAAQVGLALCSSVLALGFLAAALRCFGVI